MRRRRFGRRRGGDRARRRAGASVTRVGDAASSPHAPRWPLIADPAGLPRSCPLCRWPPLLLLRGNASSASSRAVGSTCRPGGHPRLPASRDRRGLRRRVGVGPRGGEAVEEPGRHSRAVAQLEFFAQEELKQPGWYGALMAKADRILRTGEYREPCRRMRCMRSSPAAAASRSTGSFPTRRGSRRSRRCRSRRSMPTPSCPRCSRSRRGTGRLTTRATRSERYAVTPSDPPMRARSCTWYSKKDARCTFSSCNGWAEDQAQSWPSSPPRPRPASPSRRRWRGTSSPRRTRRARCPPAPPRPRPSPRPPARRAGSRRWRCPRRCPPARQLPGAAQCVAAADGVAGGEHGRVVQLGDEALVEVAQPVHELAVARLGGHDLHVGLVLAEVPPGADEGAGGAEPRDEVGDLGAVAQDLGAGGAVVRVGVGRVAVLVEHHPVRVLRGELLGHRDGLVRPARRGRGDDLRPVHRSS